MTDFETFSRRELQGARTLVDRVLGSLVLIGEDNAHAFLRCDGRGLPVEGRLFIGPAAQVIMGGDQSGQEGEPFHEEVGRLVEVFAEGPAPAETLVVPQEPAPDPVPLRTGPWTAEEDRTLVVHLIRGGLILPVTERLNRTQADCLARFDEMVTDHGRWGLEAAARAYEAGTPGEIDMLKQVVIGEALEREQMAGGLEAVA